MTSPFSCLGSVYCNSSTIEVKQSIDSLLANTLKPSEVIVVIDGCIPHTLQHLLSEYENLNLIKTIQLPSNVGLGAALRIGLRACNNEIVCRFDTDDLNLEHRFLTLISVMESLNPRVDILTSSILEFHEGDSQFVSCSLKRSLLSHRELAFALSFRNPVHHPAVAFRKSSILAIGSYEDVPFFEDYFLWLKARKSGLVMLGIDEPLVCMRRTGALSRRHGVSYSLKEVRFAFKSFRRGLISFASLLLLVARSLSRLLPASLQLLQNFLPWRSSLSKCRNPILLSRLTIDLLEI